MELLRTTGPAHRRGCRRASSWAATVSHTSQNHIEISEAKYNDIVVDVFVVLDGSNHSSSAMGDRSSDDPESSDASGGVTSHRQDDGRSYHYASTSIEG